MNAKIGLNCNFHHLVIDDGWYDYDRKMTIHLPLTGSEIQYKRNECDTWRKGIVACIFEQDPIMVDSIDGMPYRILTINNIRPIDWDKVIKKPVDLSWLVDSDIDCEFSNNISDPRNIVIDTAGRVNAIGQIARSATDHTYQMCRPREGRSLVLTNKQFNLIPRSEFKLHNIVVDSHCGSFEQMNITTFLGLEDGYCWPWECKS